MNKPKLAVDVDAGRLVRDLLDAFSSLKTKSAAATNSSAVEEQQPPARLQDDREEASEPGGEFAVPITPAESRPEPEPALEASSERVSDLREEEREQIPEVQRASNAESSNERIEAPKTNHDIIDEFRGDREMLQRFEVTPEELHALSRVSMLGLMTSKQDLLFILRQIREAANPRISAEAYPPEPEPIRVPEERPELPTSVAAQMTEHIRREALLKLPRWQKQRDAERRRAQLGRFLSTVGSVAGMAGRRVMTTLNRGKNQ
jgi:hypothetical protein